MIFIERMLPLARERLLTIRDDASLTQAADLLDERHTSIVVACGETGAMAGIITKSDVVHQIEHCPGSACEAAVATVMTRHVTYCRPGDLLDDAWSVMKERGLQ
jgi:CBS domain-containing protein